MKAGSFLVKEKHDEKKWNVNADIITAICLWNRLFFERGI